MSANDFDFFSNLSTFLRDAANPDAAFFRVADVGPFEVADYLRKSGVSVWGCVWQGDHTVFRCQRNQGGYAVALLDRAGWSYTTSYRPAPKRRTLAKNLRRLW